MYAIEVRVSRTFWSIP